MSAPKLRRSVFALHFRQRAVPIMSLLAHPRLPRLALAACLAFASFHAPAFAETTNRPPAANPNESPEFSVTRIAGPFDHPWSMAFLPDGRMLVSERWGELKLVRPGESATQNIIGVPSRLVESHAGLMDVVLDPDFTENQTLYMSYAHGNHDGSTVRVLKARLNLETLTLEDRRLIFESSPPVPELVEFGGRMAIDGDGYLFLSLGDRLDRRRSQDLGEYHGSIIRMNRDGSFPSDNPFFDPAGARPGIWTYGHRNPQGIAVDPATGKLWAHEHGPMGGDELNMIERGRNYGWPIITYGTEYDGTPINDGRTIAEGMEQPVHYWVPSIAPSGFTIYNGHVEAWQGTAWVGALAGQMLVRLTLEGDKVVHEERFLKDEVGRIRDVRTGPDGFIYFSTDAGDGGIYRVEPVAETAGTLVPLHPELR